MVWGQVTSGGRCVSASANTAAVVTATLYTFRLHGCRDTFRRYRFHRSLIIPDHLLININWKMSQLRMSCNLKAARRRADLKSIILQNNHRKFSDNLNVWSHIPKMLWSFNLCWGRSQISSTYITVASARSSLSLVCHCGLLLLL